MTTSWEPNARQLRSFYQLIANHFLIVITLPLVTTIIIAIWPGADKILVLPLAIRPVHLFLATFVPTATITVYLILRPRDVYLVNYACFRPDSNWRMPLASYIEHARLMHFNDKHISQFVARVLERSGFGNETSVPPSFHYMLPLFGLDKTRLEAEQVIFRTIDDLLSKTCISPHAIDMLIVNCSIFNPTPSLADMIVRRYRLRGDIHSIQLSGMGCSAGLIAVGLATSLLQTAPFGAHALVVSTELFTGGYYKGSKLAMHMTNILFRTGGAAVLLSTSKAKARFQLMHVVRTSTSAQDNAYKSVIYEEDEEGNRGVNLSKDIMAIAGKALKANITTIGPLVLPASEKLSYFLSLIARKMLSGRTTLYIPDFRLAFDHFCIHAGGRAVIDAVQSSLNLSDEHVEPSRMTLHRFGNTSSSTLWYELAYSEAKGRIKKGGRVWMIGFGSGYKCISAVWKCIKPVQDVDRAWENCINRYPVHIPKGKKV
uniref:Uncharacterized protein n=1 Tax=Avena sativa TaxID=4498 RepID=A0ACD6AJA7_AVESA